MNKYTHLWNHLWYRPNHSPSSIVQDGGDTAINGTVLIYFRPFPDLCHHIGRGINPCGRAITGSGSGVGILVWVFMFRFGYLCSGYSCWGLGICVGVRVFIFRYSHLGIEVQCSGVGIQVWVFMFKYFTWHDYVITAVKFAHHPPHPCTDAHCPTLVNYPCTTSEQIPTAQSGGNT